MTAITLLSLVPGGSFTTSLPERFGANLRLARKAAGLSIDGLARLSQRNFTLIARMEQGAGIPRTDTLIRLAGALGLEPHELLVGIAWQPGPEPPRPIEKDPNQRSEIVRLWSVGKSVEAIASALGKTSGAVSSEMWRMRKQGVDLPYRIRRPAAP